MSNSPPAHEAVDGEVQLNLLPGSGEVQNADVSQAVTEQGATLCCRDKNHRKLAISSIICGLSCIGIKALIYSVKAEEATDPEEAAKLSQRAKRFGIMAIVIWVSILASIPILMALISYLLTLRD